MILGGRRLGLADLRRHLPSLVYTGRVIDVRIYRAAFTAALLAVLVVMFSLQGRPAPLSAPIAPDAFKGEVAYGDTARILKLHPDRAPGSPGDEALGSLVETRFRGLGFETRRDRF